MGDWTLYDGPELIRSGLDETEATNLVDANHAEDNVGVYALGPGGQRIPEA